MASADLTDVERHGRWTTFNPWSTAPRLAHAMAGELWGTVCFDDIVTCATRPLRELERTAELVVTEDIAGVRWPDLLWRTNEQRATLDGRFLLAAASLMAGGGDLRQSRMHVTWSGLFVWHRRAPPPRPPPTPGLEVRIHGPARNPEIVRNEHVVHLALVAAGCTKVRAVWEENVDIFERHRAELPSLPLEQPVRAALVRLLDGVRATPLELPALIDAEQRALGALAAADVAGLVARLFPEEHARHERILEEARVMGADAIWALARR